MVTRAAGRVEHALGGHRLEQPAVKRRLMGQPLRPVDEGFIAVGKVVERGRGPWKSACQGTVR